jgi:hypothetical protein
MFNIGDEFAIVVFEDEHTSVSYGNWKYACCKDNLIYAYEEDENDDTYILVYDNEDEVVLLNDVIVNYGNSMSGQLIKIQTQSQSQTQTLTLNKYVIEIETIPTTINYDKLYYETADELRRITESESEYLTQHDGFVTYGNYVVYMIQIIKCP